MLIEGWGEGGPQVMSKDIYYVLWTYNPFTRHRIEEDKDYNPSLPFNSSLLHTILNETQHKYLET